MRTLPLALAVQVKLMFLFGVSALGGDEIPAPSIDRVDHAQPAKYLVGHPSFGDGERIRQVASTLKADTPELTISAIGRWIDKNLTYDANAASMYRDFDQACASKVYGGCADHALVFAALARASGIPSVFVKTMDVDWIREFRTTGTCEVWSGHVFLEMFLEGRWRLLDAAALKLYDDYDPAMRILPGNRYAYDKGSDPRELILSTDWERWKRQTAAYFAKFDLALLPVGPGRDVSSPDDVYIAANSPIWQELTRRCRTLGFRVRKSFNHQYESTLPQAKGHFLVATCVGTTVTPPEGDYARYLPLTGDELKRCVAGGEPGIARKRLDDGTRVVLIYAADDAGLLKLIQTMELWPIP